MEQNILLNWAVSEKVVRQDSSVLIMSLASKLLAHTLSNNTFIEIQTHPQNTQVDRWTVIDVWGHK